MKSAIGFFSLKNIWSPKGWLHFFRLAVLLFGLGVTIGFISSPYIQVELRKSVEEGSFQPWTKLEAKIVKQMTDPSFPIYKRKYTRSPKLIKQSLEYFLRNYLRLAGCIYGGVAFGIFPSVQVLGVGFFFGYYCRIDLADLIKRALPHGIVEFPMIFFVCAYGLKIWSDVWAAPKGGKIAAIKENLLSGTKVILVCLPFVLVSAFLEVYGKYFLWGV